MCCMERSWIWKRSSCVIESIAPRLKQKHHWKLHRHLWTLSKRIIPWTAETISWKIKYDSFQDNRLMTLQRKPHWHLSHRGGGLTNAGKPVEREYKHPSPSLALWRDSSSRQNAWRKEEFVLHRKFKSKGMCDVLSSCQGTKWTSWKEKGTWRKRPLDVMQKLLNLLENYISFWAGVISQSNSVF